MRLTGEMTGETLKFRMVNYSIWHEFSMFSLELTIEVQSREGRVEIWSRNALLATFLRNDFSNVLVGQSDRQNEE